MKIHPNFPHCLYNIVRGTSSNPLTVLMEKPCMNKREDILSFLDPTYVPQTIPAAFFLHFDPAFHRGQAAVEKHLEYFHATGMDFVKIQYEHSFPRLPQIERPEDWGKMPFYGLDFYEEPLRVVDGLVRAAKAEAVVVLTLYSPFMFARQTTSDETITRHILENPQAVQRGMQVITDSLMGFVRACLRLGLDGFYTSTQGGEAGRFPERSERSLFDECIRPYDLAVMEEAHRTATFNILHVCDYQLPYSDLSPYVDYPGHVVNASLELTTGKTTPRAVASLFGRPFMGGMNRLGILASGTPAQARQAAEAAMADIPDRFILGADCTVPSDTPLANLRAAIDAAHEHKR
jgi:uroporphyrinogen decarboxylase